MSHTGWKVILMLLLSTLTLVGTLRSALGPKDPLGDLDISTEVANLEAANEGELQSAVSSLFTKIKSKVRGAPPGRSTKVDLVKAQKIREVYLSLKPGVGEVSKWAKSIGPHCPPVVLMVDGKARFLKNFHEFGGSESKIYLSHEGDLAFKLIAPQESIFEPLMREKSMLVALDGLGGKTTRIHDWESVTGQNPACSGLSMVTEFAGYYTMDRLGTLSEKQVAAIAASAIEILREVHRVGSIHGDIHVRNFVASDRRRPAQTLKIIDFGRSAPFVNPDTGLHVPYVKDRRDSRWNSPLLSPFELEGSPAARRDDMYRLAEMLYVMLGAQLPKPVDSVNLAQIKRMWVLPGKNRIFSDFHQGMVNLAFDEEPKYDHWIEKFRAFAA